MAINASLAISYGFPLYCSLEGKVPFLRFRLGQEGKKDIMGHSMEKQQLIIT